VAFETLLYDVADRVATVTLNRPDRLNAVNTTVIRELVEAFDQADGDDGVRAVIVTGPAAPSAPAPTWAAEARPSPAGPDAASARKTIATAAASSRCGSSR
jgi:hypothetical protein